MELFLNKINKPDSILERVIVKSMWLLSQNNDCTTQGSLEVFELIRHFYRNTILIYVTSY